jgi:hypothetical protein
MKKAMATAALLCLVVLGVSVAGPAGAAQGGVNVAINPGCGGAQPLRERPSLIGLTCDPIAMVEGVKWSSWGGATAHGTGVYSVADLKKGTSVAAAPRIKYHGTITASHIVTCGAKRIYREVIMSFKSAGKSRRVELPGPLCAL